MQESSRIQGVSPALLTLLLYRHPDPDIQARWKYFAVALVVGIQMAWYEVVFIFPTNDRLVDMEGELERKKAKGEEVREERERELRGKVLRPLEKCRMWHIRPIAVPLVCTCFAIAGLIS